MSAEIPSALARRSGGYTKWHVFSVDDNRHGPRSGHWIRRTELISPMLDTPMHIAALLISASVVLFVSYSLFEARWIRVVRDEFASPNLPPEFEGTRLVFLADVHAGPFFGAGSMNRLVASVNELDPDILVLGGDYVGGRRSGANVFYPRVGGFEARCAKLAVLGNHDVWEGAQRARAGLADAGFNVLENESVAVCGDVGPAIHVAGVDDLYTGNPDLARAARDIPADSFAVLVSHNPDVFAGQLDETGDTWDLALAGHTHAGQLTWFGIMAPLVPSSHGQRYRSGWRSESNVPILVTTGVGTVTLPMRVFARPEIHVVTLHGE